MRFVFGGYNFQNIDTEIVIEKLIFISIHYNTSVVSISMILIFFFNYKLNNISYFFTVGSKKQYSIRVYIIIYLKHSTVMERAGF